VRQTDHDSRRALHCLRSEVPYRGSGSGSGAAAAAFENIVLTRAARLQRHARNHQPVDFVGAFEKAG